VAPRLRPRPVASRRPASHSRVHRRAAAFSSGGSRPRARQRQRHAA
jgi:hypothetical protein